MRDPLNTVASHARVALSPRISPGEPAQPLSRNRVGAGGDGRPELAHRPLLHLSRPLTRNSPLPAEVGERGRFFRVSQQALFDDAALAGIQALRRAFDRRGEAAFDFA